MSWSPSTHARFDCASQSGIIQFIAETFIFGIVYPTMTLRVHHFQTSTSRTTYSTCVDESFLLRVMAGDTMPQENLRITKNGAIVRPYCHIDARFCCCCSAYSDASVVWSIYDASPNHYGFASYGLLMHHHSFDPPFHNHHASALILVWASIPARDAPPQFPASRLNFPAPTPACSPPTPSSCTMHPLFYNRDICTIQLFFTKST